MNKKITTALLFSILSISSTLAADGEIKVGIDDGATVYVQVKDPQPKVYQGKYLTFIAHLVDQDGSESMILTGATCGSEKFVGSEVFKKKAANATEWEDIYMLQAAEYIVFRNNPARVKPNSIMEKVIDTACGHAVYADGIVVPKTRRD